MHVGRMRMDASLLAAHSLKDKRMVVKSLKDRIRNRFNVSVAEVDNQDLWQRATLGVAAVSGDRAFLEEALRKVLGFVEASGSVRVDTFEIEVD